jgi:hypothetical protein
MNQNNFEHIAKTMTQLGHLYSQKLKEAMDAVESWLEENRDFFEWIQTTAVQLNKWQESQKINVNRMSQRGWFPNWCTIVFESDFNIEEIDQIMTKHLNEDWEEITEEIIKYCPSRKHILETAFSLHIEGNHIASIPLFCSQSDGIFIEKFQKPFFSDKKREKALQNLVYSGEFQNEFFKNIFLEPLIINTQFSAQSNKFKPEDKTKAPNRHGIIHGDIRHLDYGTEINSLKCFSLLAFIVYSTKEVFIDNK